MAIDRAALLASLPPEYLADPNYASSLDYVKSLDDKSLATYVSSINANRQKSFDELMALGEKQTAWQQAAADYAKENIYGNYAVDQPLDYYKSFGTIPINSLGESFYGIDPNTWQTDTAKGAEGIKYITPTAGAKYELYSPKTGQIFGTATSPEELAALAKTAQEQSVGKGFKADWELRETVPGQESKVIASNLYNKDVTLLGQIFGSLLPVATAFIPGLNVLGTIATQAASGAAGAAMAGRNPLTGALIGGATAGLLKAPILSGNQSISGALGNALGAGGKGALQAAAGAVPGEIVVMAAPKLAESAINAGIAGLTQQIGSTLPSLTQTATQPTTFDQAFPPSGGGLSALEPPITVIGTPSSALNIASGIPGIGAGALSAAINAAQPSAASGADRLEQVQEQPTDEIIVRGEPKPLDLGLPVPVPTIPTGALETIANTIPSLPEPEVPPTDEIVVKAKPETTTTPVPSVVPTTTTTTQPTETKADAKTETEPTKEKSTLDKVIDYIQLGALGTGLLGDLFGGGGGGNGALGTIPAGLFGSGTGTSIFDKPLPAPNLPGLGTGGTGIGARTAADLTATTGLPTPGTGASNIDWYRYGYGPEQSFFKQVPQGAKNVSQAYTGYEVPFRGLQNMAQGGYAVGGPGDGRDDKIPAMLSDGEYVMDAETVAMLGNGSSKAGADALDRFRVNIRKQKGRSMARGNFSVKAKKPEQYLKKDRA